MRIALSRQAEKSYKKLPPKIKIKADKQILGLFKKPTPASLRVKKLIGEKDKFEARIDYHYRFVYSLEDDLLKIHSLGPHDEGLGKK